ncbi:MAG: HAMP domain-containing histidine kinase, partial [Deltaproteobacteria bacterium]|nr:HAMP domain-containing histidine kinase [Deltaproteobacteria bacterium]
GSRRDEQRARRDERRRERRERHRKHVAAQRERNTERSERPRSRRRSKLTAEERRYREAQRVANAKLSFVVHFVVYSMVCFFLLMVAGFRAAFIVALAWGIGLVMHYVVAVIAPVLRQRWIHQEVSRQVTTTTTQQRRELHGEHSRHLEELSASIAHEIRNPITAAKSLVQQMGEDPRAADNVEYAQVALEELDRVERSISHLLRFARDEDVEMRTMSIVDVVDSALETFRDRVVRLGIKITRVVDADGEMMGDPEKLRRVVINLFANALDALGESATPSPSLEIQAGENLAGDAVWVRIKDNGPGIEPERMNKIFSPFYTSKESGTGLGLALSKKVVDAHGGTIAAESSPGHGTEFVLTFPKHRGDGGTAS